MVDITTQEHFDNAVAALEGGGTDADFIFKTQVDVVIDTTALGAYISNKQSDSMLLINFFSGDGNKHKVTGMEISRNGVAGQTRAQLWYHDIEVISDINFTGSITFIPEDSIVNGNAALSSSRLGSNGIIIRNSSIIGDLNVDNANINIYDGSEVKGMTTASNGAALFTVGNKYIIPHLVLQGAGTGAVLRGDGVNSVITNLEVKNNAQADIYAGVIIGSDAGAAAITVDFAKIQTIGTAVNSSSVNQADVILQPLTGVILEPVTNGNNNLPNEFVQAASLLSGSAVNGGIIITGNSVFDLSGIVPTASSAVRLQIGVGAYGDMKNSQLSDTDIAVTPGDNTIPREINFSGNTITGNLNVTAIDNATGTGTAAFPINFTDNAITGDAVVAPAANPSTPLVIKFDNDAIDGKLQIKSGYVQYDSSATDITTVTAPSVATVELDGSTYSVHADAAPEDRRALFWEMKEAFDVAVQMSSAIARIDECDLIHETVKVIPPGGNNMVCKSFLPFILK